MMHVNPVHNNAEYAIVALDPPHTNGNGLHHHIEVQEAPPQYVVKFRQCIVFLGSMSFLLFLVGTALNASGENEAANTCFMASAIAVFVAGCLLPGAVRV